MTLCLVAVIQIFSFLPQQQLQKNSGLGLFNINPPSPFQSHRARLVLDYPETIKPKQLDLKITNYWASLWSYKPAAFLIDGESIKNTLQIRLGLTDWISIETDVAAGWQGGGSLDSFINNFDRIINTNSQRTAETYFNRRVIHLTRKDGTIYLEKGSTGYDLDDALFITHFIITDGSYWLPALAIHAYSGLSINTNNLLDNKSLYPGISVAASKKFYDFYFYVSTSYTYWGSNKFAAIPLKEQTLASAYSIEWSLHKKISFITQFIWQSPVAKDYYAFSSSTYQIASGFKFQISQSTLLELALFENLIHYQNTPDIGFYLGFSYKL